MAYLIKTVETYRLGSEPEVEEFLANQKEKYEIVKYNSERKEIKEKKEVVDTYYLLTVTKIFNDPKEPERIIEIEYTEE